MLDYVLRGSVTWRAGGTLADGKKILIDHKTTSYTLAQLRTLLWCQHWKVEMRSWQNSCALLTLRGAWKRRQQKQWRDPAQYSVTSISLSVVLMSGVMSLWPYFPAISLIKFQNWYKVSSKSIKYVSDFLVFFIICSIIWHYYKINFLITVTSNKHCTKRQTENRDEGENRDELNFKTLALYRVKHEVTDLGLVGKQVLTMCRRKQT